MIDPTLKAVLMILVGAVVGYAFNRLSRNRDRKSDKALSDEKVAIEAVKVRDLRISELERSVQLLEDRSAEQRKAAVPIEAAMQAMLIAKLTNDHTPETDALLKKVTDDTLTVNDAKEFAKAMKERSKDKDPRIGEAQRIAADILPGMMRLKELRDQEEKESGCEAKTITVTVPETATVPAADGGTQEEEKGN